MGVRPGAPHESGDVEAMCARHAAHYRQMAEGANERLRGATGPLWRERLTSELGNLRAASHWFIATGDADAALSLASGMAWLWFINSELWRERAGSMTHSVQTESAAPNSLLPLGFLTAFSSVWPSDRLPLFPNVKRR